MEAGHKDYLNLLCTLGTLPCGQAQALLLRRHEETTNFVTFKSPLHYRPGNDEMTVAEGRSSPKDRNLFPLREGKANLGYLRKPQIQ
ncbi:hypothetical protein BT69DRAFT_1290340 [Atractiella rhizophila]|nr:hypothetical protein BT69DRAFT_1290340 [Atractiella rhizophila]